MPIIVMELVDGEDLGERLKRGPVPIDDALAIATQIADALEAAHEKGIVHRDLKPANVKVGADERVKVLDFGLAKAIDPAASGPVNPSISPTLTAATMPDVILGTAAYMAPEQAKGRVVDKRADIWAFGCVLYELLTGRRAFDGEDISDTLAFVLTKDPDWTALPAATGVHVRRLLRRCLEKDPKKRLRDIGEARIALDDAPKEIAAPSTAPAGVRRPRPWGWIVATLLLAAALVAWTLKAAPAVEAPLMELEIAPPDGVTLLNSVSGSRSPVGLQSVSPDGHYLLFRGVVAEGRPMLWLRSISDHTMTPIPGTEGAVVAFWSHDSRAIAFTANGRLQRLAMGGGTPQFICNADSIIGADWNQNGVILFADRDKPIQRVSASGGTPTVVLPFDAASEEGSQSSPQFLPDGRQFLYSSNGRTRGVVMLANLDTGQRRPPFTNVNSPAHFTTTPDGRGWLLFVNRDQLFAREFDAKAGAVRGEAVGLVERVAAGPIWGASQNGLLMIQRGLTDFGQMTWVDRRGTVLGTVAEPGEIRAPRLSPDGKHVAYALTDRQLPDVWIADTERNHQERFTMDPGIDGYPNWTPDGQSLVYLSLRGSDRLVVERQIIGAKERVLFREINNAGMFLSNLSADGRLLPMTLTGGAATRVALLTRPDGKVLRVIENETAGHATIAPAATTSCSRDSRLAVVKSMSRRSRMPTTLRSRSPSDRFRRPAAPSRCGDETEKKYCTVADDGTMMSVTVEQAGHALTFGSPSELFRTRLGDTNQRDYDVTADGQRFLIKQPTAFTSSSVSLIVNWPKLLQK